MVPTVRFSHPSRGRENRLIMIFAISVALMLLLAFGVASSIHAEVGGTVHETFSEPSAAAQTVQESDPAFTSGNLGGTAICAVGVLLALAVLWRLRGLRPFVSCSPANIFLRRASRITRHPGWPTTCLSLTQLRISRT